ncbi:MAG: hypothetical protein K0B09_11850 [Bacteroidales bacterium]|nr:hypothetical protein [Bacteroidales bacterium]
MKQKILKAGGLAAVLVMVMAAPLHSQSNIGIAAGGGFPEASHLGLRYHWQQTNVGVYYGLAEDWRSAGIAMGFHLFGYSKHTPTKPIYFKAGIFSNRGENFFFWERLKYNSLELRAGYTINFSPRFGLELEAGPAIAFRLELDNKYRGAGFAAGFAGRFFVKF